MNQTVSFSKNLNISLVQQEENRVAYWKDFDPFIDLRLKWRASMVRHLFHILPGKRILEIGSGSGKFVKALAKVTRNECPITSIVFSEDLQKSLKEKVQKDNIDVKYVSDINYFLEEEKFDYVVAHSMLHDQTRNEFLIMAKRFLKSGGGLVLFEPNPWNPYLQLRKFFRQLFPMGWKRPQEPVSLDRLQIFSVLSQIGYTHINALPYDFLYHPIPKCLLWPAKNLSLILENCPIIRNFAGSLYIWASNGENNVIPAEAGIQDLCDHEMLLNKVSFVILCHNEEAVIASFVEGIKQFYDRYVCEIIVVDDNSQDRSAEIVQELAKKDQRIRLLKRKPPNGVGRALRDGLSLAKGNYVMTMDADFQEILPEMRDLFDAMAQGADVAIGSRFSRESVLLNYPFTKIVANRMFHILANFLLKKHFRDISNNLKILKREVVEKIEIESNDFAANAETGLKPLLMGYDVREVPISWINRSVDMGLSSFKLMKTGPNYFKFLMRLMK